MDTKKIRTYSNDTKLIEKRRAQILDTATKLFIKNGYLKTTTRDVAKSCGMSIGNLYHYIGSKEDILSLLSQNTLFLINNSFKEPCQKLSTKSQSIQLKKVIKKYIAIVDEYQHLIIFWYQEIKNLSRDARKVIFLIDEHSRKIFKKILDKGCKNKEFKTVDTTIVANNIMLICDQWAFRRRYLKDKYTLEDFSNKQIEYIMRILKK